MSDIMKPTTGETIHRTDQQLRVHEQHSLISIANEEHVPLMKIGVPTTFRRAFADEVVRRWNDHQGLVAAAQMAMAELEFGGNWEVAKARLREAIIGGKR